MKKEANFFLKLSISIIIIGILLYKVGFNNIVQALTSVNLLYLPLVIIINICPFLIGALNLKILIDCTGRIQFWKILKYYLLSWAVGLFVPGKIGEFSIIYLLRKEDINIGQGFAISLMDKLITILTLSLLTVLCFLVFFTKIETIKLIVTLSIIFLILIFFIITNTGRGFIKKYVLRKYSEKFVGFSKTFFYFIKNKKNILALNFALTFLKWVLNSLAIAVLFLAFNTTTRFYYIIIITAATTIVEVVPFTISGLGLRESMAVFFYSLVNIEPSISASVHLILTILIYTYAALIFFTADTKKIRNKVD